MELEDVIEFEHRVEEIYGKQKPYRPQVEGFVYFVQEVDDGPVKIGWASNPKRRLASMQSGNPRQLRLLGVVAGRRELERKLHDRFAVDHLTGEWFAISAAMLSFIEDIAS